MQDLKDPRPTTAWNRTFELLAGAELGRSPGWQGPADAEELQARVETLAVLLNVVPRSELGRLADVVHHLAGSFPEGATVNAKDLRNMARTFLHLPEDSASRTDLYFERAAKAASRQNRQAVVSVESPSSPVPDDAAGMQCTVGLGKWLTNLDTQRRWTHVRSLAEDEPEARIEDVFVELLAVPSEHLQGDAPTTLDRRSATRRLSSGRYAAIDAGTMVARATEMCLLIGEPGGGKSTVVQWLARKVAAGEIGDFDLPIVVKLGAFAAALADEPGLTLIEFFLESQGTKLDDWSAAAEWLRSAGRESRRYLLLLDGWDEVPPGLREEVHDRIRAERTSFTTVVTSRPSGLPMRLADGKRVEVYQIAGLTAEAIQEAVTRQLSVLGHPEKTASVLRQIISRTDLADMAANPLMLGLVTRLLLIHGVERSGDWTQADLYRLAVDWIAQSTRDRNSESHGHLLRSMSGLGRLSHRLLFEDATPRYLFSGHEIAREVEAGCAHAVTQSRLVTKVDLLGREYAFLHATFQEYLAATHFDHLGAEQQRERLEKAFLSGARLVVLEFTAGLPTAAGESCRAQLARWAERKDRFHLVLLRVARLLAASPGKPGRAGHTGLEGLRHRVRNDLWDSIVGESTFAIVRPCVEAFAQLDPVALVHAAKATPELSSFVIECIVDAIPPSVGRAESVEVLMDPSRRERAGPTPWDAPTASESEANRLVLSDPRASEEALRDAAIAAAASADLKAVPLIGEILRRGVKDEQLAEELSLALGLIGGKEAADLLVDLVTGDVPTARVAAGLARRALRHATGGLRRLDPAGRDAIVRRIATWPADHPSMDRMLSALEDFPVRTGSRLLRVMASDQRHAEELRIKCMLALGASPNEADIDALVEGLSDAANLPVASTILSLAVARRRPVPTRWLKGRFAASTDWREKRVLLTVAINMVSDPRRRSIEVEAFLGELVRAVLKKGASGAADLTDAMRRDLTEFPLDGASTRAWVQPELVRKVLEGFREKRDVASEQVKLAAALAMHVTEPWAAALLLSCLTSAFDRWDQPLMEDQKRELESVGGAISHALAQVDPVALLRVKQEWKPVTEALRLLATQRGWLVFEDRMYDADGVRVVPRWGDETPNASDSTLPATTGDASAVADRSPQDLESQALLRWQGVRDIHKDICQRILFSLAATPGQIEEDLTQSISASKLHVSRQTVNRRIKQYLGDFVTKLDKGRGLKPLGSALVQHWRNQRFKAEKSAPEQP